jgi:hypothetical protein
MKKPALTLVDKDTGTAPPPRPLGKHGDCAGRELLCSACQALDRAEDCSRRSRRPCLREEALRSVSWFYSAGAQTAQVNPL